MIFKRVSPSFLWSDFSNLPDQSSPFDEDNTNRRFLSALLRAVNYAVEHELTSRQRACFERYYLQHKTMPQIAKELGVSPSTVSRHLRAARSRVRCFARYCAFGFKPRPD